MMMLWISCLLIGSITCTPVPKDSGSHSAPATFIQQPSSSGYWYGGAVSSDPGSSSSLPSLPHPGSELPAPKDVGPSAVSEYQVAYAAPQYAGSAPGGSYSGGYGSYGFVAAPEDENWSSGSATSYAAPDEASEESPEPVFSDVSDLEPVYAFSSRSSYQRGRGQFAQTRYIPGPPVYPPMPASRSISRVSSKQSAPAKAPTKGGF